MRDKNEVRIYMYVHSVVGEYSPPAEPKSIIFTLRKSSETTMCIRFHVAVDQGHLVRVGQPSDCTQAQPRT